MFAHGSRAAELFFGNAPPSIIEDRPETAYLFLRWLLPRHEKLHTLVARDLEQRQLDPARSGVAVATLANRDHLLRRHIDLVMVSKGLYLWYAAQKEPYIMMQSAFSDVLKKARDVITSKAVDNYVLSTLDCSEETADRLAAERRTAVFCKMGGTWIRWLVG